ncbi:hypothetical protein NIES3275_36450 [Microchaete diplosiphon NIES-3275]|nr:hypothetical protein NIES3275_36450 [Microchaete diplosiphon NIES-3275]
MAVPCPLEYIDVSPTLFDLALDELIATSQELGFYKYEY